MGNVSATQLHYLNSIKRHRQVVKILRIVVLVAFLSLWEIATQLGLIDSFIFSSPSRIVRCFISMLKDKSIFLHIGITLTETIISFFLVTIFSIGITILLWLSKKFAEVLEPYLVILNSLPKSALAPLLIVWLGATSKTIIVAGMSVAIFGTIINLHATFSGVSKDKIKLIQTLGGNRKDILLKVVIPSNIPAIISNMKVNIGLCLVGVIIGEFLAAKDGLGYLIIYGSQVFKLDWVMMSIFILCIIAMILYQVINQLEKLYSKRI